MIKWINTDMAKWIGFLSSSAALIINLFGYKRFTSFISNNWLSLILGTIVIITLSLLFKKYITTWKEKQYQIKRDTEDLETKITRLSEKMELLDNSISPEIEILKRKENEYFKYVSIVEPVINELMKRKAMKETNFVESYKEIKKIYPITNNM